MLFLELRDNCNNFINASQNNLEVHFGSLVNRFDEKKCRVGSFIHPSSYPYNHSYNTSTINLTLDLMCDAAAGVRTTENILKVFSRYIDIPTPARTTINHWQCMVGLYIYNLPIEKADDWIWMIDLSIPLGS